MIDFISKLEKDFSVEIIQSSNHIPFTNTFGLDENNNIKSLYLYGVELISIDILLPVASHLKDLWIQDCKVRELLSLSKFENLSKLCLDSNPLKASAYDSICNLEQLQELRLEETTLEDTSQFKSLKNLQKLFIGYCNNLRFVNGLEELENLIHLDLEFSQISRIEDVNINESIESINLRNSQIQRISSLERYPNLSTLELPGNPISKIEGLNHLNRLKRLIISSANINYIEGLDNLVNLEVLDLSNNLYGNLDEITGLDSLINLKRLNLNENKIRKVENLTNLMNLEFLLLECNRISEFDTTFLHTLRNECYISLVGNPIKTISELIPENVIIQFEDSNWTPKGL